MTRIRLSTTGWLRLLALLGGFTLAGGLLLAQGAPAMVWVAMEAMILYLAWSGTGAIALSSVAVTGMMWAVTLSKWSAPEVLGVGRMLLNPAQIWAIGLIGIWLLAIGLTFWLGFVVRHLTTAGFSKLTTLCLVVFVANLGLRLGQMLEINTMNGQ